jgi:transcriptional regulator with AAA-type ATPase domain
VRSSLHEAFFTSKGDRALVVRLYNEHIAKLGHVMVRWCEAVEGEYEGERNAAGEMEGHGTKRYADGSVYEGEWKATHRPLRDMIAARSFREDLYYRLNGLVVQLPPLRDRSDLMVLAERLLKRECRDRMPRLSEEVVALMQAYHWPGNIRQLATLLRTAAAMVGTEPVITVEHLSEDFLLDARLMAPTLPSAQTSAKAAPQDDAADREPEAAPPGRTLQQLENDTVRRALAEAGGNISVAARRLGISRNTIYRKLYWPPGAGR